MGAIGAAQRPRVSPGMPDDLADGLGVQLFSSAMRDRLIEKRSEGRHGWHDPEVCNERALVDALTHQFEAYTTDSDGDEYKVPVDFTGNDLDLVDIANYAMMLWNRRRQERFE